MLTEQRHEIILQLLKENGSVTVNQLKEMWGISESTIRRDLTYLDKIGKLTKVFGGAILQEDDYSAIEQSVTQKSELNSIEKNMIGSFAATLITAEDFVYIDAGTTTEQMVKHITCMEATYITNAVVHARELAAKGFKVILVGGILKGTTEAIVGNQAVTSISKMHFTKGFFGTNGITKNAGFTTPDVSEACVKQVALENSKAKFILADSGKFDKISAVTFADYNRVNIITDKAVPDKYKEDENVIIVEE